MYAFKQNVCSYSIDIYYCSNGRHKNTFMYHFCSVFITARCVCEVVEYWLMSGYSLYTHDLKESYYEVAGKECFEMIMILPF